MRIAVLRRPFPGVVIALVCCCGLATLHQQHYDFEHDDAYISYRYADNWAKGVGAVYNRGERVEGYTNFLHVVVLRQLALFGLDLRETSRSLGSFSFGLLILLVFLFVSIELGRGPAWGLIAAAITATNAALAVWARSGLETVPYGLLVSLGAFTFLAERRRGKPHWLSGAVFGLVGILRADGLFFAVLTGAFLYWRMRRLGPTASFALSVTAVVVPVTAWRISYYGDLFPNSYT